MSRPNEIGSGYTYIRCPYCHDIPEYTHRDGLPVCRCRVASCPGNARWLEYGDFAEQRLVQRLIETELKPVWRKVRRMCGLKPHIYFEAGEWCVMYNSRHSDAVLIEQAKLFVFRRNRELEENGK